MSSRTEGKTSELVTVNDGESKESNDYLRRFTDTETFQVYILHNTTEYIEKHGIEKVFVDNCSMFGITYFLYVFTTLYDDKMQSLKGELSEIVKDEDTLDKVYRYLKTYIIEYYIRDTQFGNTSAMYDIVRHCQANESIGILEYLYQQCDTSVETDILLRKLYDGISPETLTQFEICDMYSTLCTWKRFRNYLTSHVRWCMKTLRSNERSILHRVFHISYTRKTFSEIHVHLESLTGLLFKHATVPYLTWITTTLRQNKFRRNDKWIIGMRTEEPVTSMKEHVLMNIFACLQNHRSESPTYSISEFVDAYQGETSITDTPSNTYVLYLQCQAFDIIIHPLFKKLDYIVSQYMELDTIIEMATVEYTTNENASLSAISSSLTEMFRNKVSYLATSLDLKHILVPKALEIIHQHGYDVLRWLNEVTDSIFFRTNHHMFLTTIQNILFVLNYAKQKLKYHYSISDEIRTSTMALCVKLLVSSSFSVHYKREILEYLQLHRGAKRMTSKQAGDLWTYYATLEKGSGYPDEIKEQQNTIISLMKEHVLASNQMQKGRLFEVDDPSSLVFSIIHNLTVRMESYRDNYEYARQKYYSDRVLSLREIISQEKYSKWIQSDITKTLELLNILNVSCRFYTFRETLLEKLNTEKLCEILLYIIRYSTTRYHRTCPIMSKAVGLILYLVTFSDFCRAFVKVCNSTEPEEFKILQNIIHEADFKRHIVGDEVHESIHKILVTLKHYEGTLIDYDTVEIPFELLDPLMHTLIENPCVIPETNTIMEKSVIVRYLKTKEQNPFTRSKLTLKDLEEFNETEQAKKLRYQFDTKLQDFYTEHTTKVCSGIGKQETKTNDETKSESKTSQLQEEKTKQEDDDTKLEAKTFDVVETKQDTEDIDTRQEANASDISTEVSDNDTDPSTDIGDSDTTEPSVERGHSRLTPDEHTDGK